MDRSATRYYLPFLGWALFIFVASSIPSDSIPNLSIFHQDKLLHAVVYYVFAWLGYRALTHQKRFLQLHRYPKLWTLTITVFYAASDEIHQLFVTGRSSDYRDLVADGFGAILFIATISVVEEWRSQRRPPAASV